MDPAYLSPIVASLAAAPQVGQQLAAARAKRDAAKSVDDEAIARPVETLDAIDAIGDHGDDARRRDKRAEPHEDPPEHVNIVA